MTLNKKQIQFLKKAAHHLKPVFQVGKHGLSDTQITQIGFALEKQELLKVSLLQNTLEDTGSVAEQLVQGLGAVIVQEIGHTVVVYRPSSKEKYQKLSQQVSALG